MSAIAPHASALKLKASPGSWRLFSARKSDPRFRLYETKVLQRDGYRCQFCGFQAQEYQDVINLDSDYHNNKIDNLVTACCFCSQCFFLESVGVGGFGGGSLIFAPELTQAELNILCHVLFCAITNDVGYKSSAQTIYLEFKTRSQQVEQQFGEGTSDPVVFGHLLIDSGEKVNPEQMDKAMLGIRLLPSRARFRKQMETWATNALNEIALKPIKVASNGA